MSLDAQGTSGDSPARQLAFIFGAIADTLEWQHGEYQAFTARLLGSGTPALSLNLGDVLAAYTATMQASSGKRIAADKGGQ